MAAAIEVTRTGDSRLTTWRGTARHESVAQDDQSGADGATKGRNAASGSATKDDGSDSSKKESKAGVVSGLTLAERKACYWELIAAEDLAVATAEAAFPLDADPPDVDAHLDLRFRLLEESEAALRKKYGLTSEELAAIAEEGIWNSWPMPPLEQ